MDTKDRIIKCYLTAGEEEGFLNISLSKLAEKAGIKKATIFSHFKDKKAIEEEAVSKALTALQESQINVDFKAKDMESLFVSLINSFLDVFTAFPVSSLLKYCEQLRSIDKRALKISEDIDKIISSRLLVALDYCVQRSWTDTDNTDALSELLCPNIRQMIGNYTDEETLIDNLLHLLQERNAN